MKGDHLLAPVRLQLLTLSSASLAGEPGRYEGRQLQTSQCTRRPCCPLFLSSRVLPLSVYTKVEDGAIIRLSRLVTVLVELAFLLLSAFRFLQGFTAFWVSLSGSCGTLPTSRSWYDCIGLRATFQSGTRHCPPPS